MHESLFGWRTSEMKTKRWGSGNKGILVMTDYNHFFTMESILLRVLCVCSLFSMVYLQNVTNCRIPKCEIYLRERQAPNTMHYLNETMETKVFGLRIFLKEPYTDSRCYVDTKEFIDAFNFDTKPV